jgi:hypothetical protein
VAYASPHTLGATRPGTPSNMDALNVITICGSLRKASFNAALARQLPGLARDSLRVTAAPAWEAIPSIQHRSGHELDQNNQSALPVRFTLTRRDES